MGLSAKAQYITLSTLTLCLMSVVIVILIATLRVSPPADGGSPDGPPREPANGDLVPEYFSLDEESSNSVASKVVGQKDYVNYIPPPLPRQEHDKKYSKDTMSKDKVSKDEMAKNEVINDERPKDADEVTKSKITKDGETKVEVTADSQFRQFRYAAVAADADPCNTIGTDILAEKRGSAVDAAIAVMLCVGVVHCHNSGIGGGHFMTIYEVPNDGSTEKVLNTILARERAPLNASRDMFVNTTASSSKGGLSIAVPGEVRGFYKAWQKFGRASWRDLIQPSIDLCVNGHPVSKPLSDAIQSYQIAIRRDPNLRELFVKEDGTLVQEGDTLLRPKMAATLETIAEDPDAFYNPESQLAQDIVADIQEYGGIITLEDLAIYDIYDKSPLSVHLDNGDFTLYGPRPPSSGVILQYILSILNGYNFTTSDLTEDEQRILTYHRIAEAFKFAYAERSKLGDEEYVDGIRWIIRNLTSPEYADATRAKINDSFTQDVWYYSPDFDIFEDAGTSHGNVFTADGSAVAITSTINLFFGSNVRGSRTGIFFNDEMDDFSTPGDSNDFGVPSSPANYIEPYKMPMSSMCPTITLDSDGIVRFLSGAAGGTRITTTTSYVSMHALWFDMRVDEATDHKRMHHQLVPHEIRTELDFDEVVYAGLEDKGHIMDPNQSNLASVQSIHNTCQQGDTGECIHAACDGRKSGVPDGY